MKCTFAGELDPAYTAISGNEHIPTWPINNPYRWNLLLDAVIVNETITVPTTKVTGAPSNKAVVLMDSGSSYTYVLYSTPIRFPFKGPLDMHHQPLCKPFTVTFQERTTIKHLATGGFLAQLKLTWPYKLGECFTALSRTLIIFILLPVVKSFPSTPWISTQQLLISKSA
jgi:hypothetical protein